MLKTRTKESIEHLRVLLTLLVLFFCSFSSSASHIVGGEMYYNSLGNNQYRVFCVLYRDCDSDGAEFDDTLSLGIFNSNGGLVENRLVPFPGSQILPVIFENPCVTPPNGVCTERAIYQTVVNLPPIPGGYDLVYQRCCRGPSITNLELPEDTGLTLVSHIPGSDTGAEDNSSPRFTNYPPLVICSNDDLLFDHSATDPDGDSLVYRMFTPNAGADGNFPKPSPPPSPPYPLVQWEAGHTQNQPLGNFSDVQLSPVSGAMVANPGLPGKYVVGVKVEEYRNDVLINSSVRDFLFVVVPCDIELQADLPLQTELSTFNGYCDGLTVVFENNSYGGSNYLWNFGDPNTTADASTAFAPTYTYTESGTFIAQVIVNPGQPCTDTAFMEVRVRDGIQMNVSATDSICFIQHSVDFLVTSDGDSTVSYDWDFGTNASVQTVSDTDQVLGVTFNNPGVFPITVYAEDLECQGEVTLDVYIYDFPVADFLLPVDYPCGGQTVNFENLSTNSFNHTWDFGDGVGTSSDENPSYTYPNPGTYVIELISGSTGVCFDTVEHEYKIYEDLIMSIDNNDSLCIVDNQFYFNGIVSGPDSTTLTWDFGPYANPTTSNDTLNPNVSFSIPGNHTVTLTGEYLMCSQTESTSIFIYKEPEIGFDIAPGQQCQPFGAQFYEQCDADTEIFYEWDLGNGQTSNLPNPSTIYNDTGIFVIDLLIYTTSGCIDTLTLSRDDLVNVRPKPTAAFRMSAIEIDICPGLITFYDESEGAVKYSYLLDDLGRIASDVPAEYNYIYSTSGTKNVVQIVENIHGCKDTSVQQLSVFPYSVYVPNVFTPNNDKHNNDFLTVTSQEPLEWHLRIYNRYGALVYESFDQDEFWDGTFNGAPVPDGLYSYVIDLVACGKENPNRSFTGTIAVIR